MISSKKAREDERDFDCVIFGATGFTGKFIVEKFAAEASNHNLKWAIAGRNREKLEELRNTQDQHLGLLVVDARDELQVMEMCKRTCLVISAAGPFQLFGELVVKCCAFSGTDYIDVCGEPYFLEVIDSLAREGKEKKDPNL